MSEEIPFSCRNFFAILRHRPKKLIRFTTMEEDNEHLIQNQSSEVSLAKTEDDIRSHPAIKFGFPSILAILLGLSLSGPLVNSYFSIKGKELTLPDLAAPGGKIVLEVPGATIRSSRIEFAASDIGEVMYKVGDETLDHEDFVHFSKEILGMRYTIAAWSVIQFFSYTAAVAAASALGVYLWKREFPTTRIFKLRLNREEETSWFAVYPVWSLFFVAVTSLFRLLFVTSFVQSISTRVALYAIKMSFTPLAWQDFLTAVNESNPRTYQLNLLIALGEWYKENGAFWNFSTFSIVLESLIAMAGFVAVFYLDSRDTRSSLAIIQIESIQKQLDRLPIHCRMMPLWASVTSLFLASLISKFSGMDVFNLGKYVNRLPWVSSLDLGPSKPIQDLIVSQTSGFWFNPAAVVDGAVMAWVPMVVMIVLGSIARWEALSKLIEIIAIGYWIRAASIGVTVFPTPMSVLQTPQCYTETEMGIVEAFGTSEFCNDLMYSGHATLVLTPAFVMILMVIYGPFQYKSLTIGGICISLIVSISIVIVGRFHYSSDVLVAALICFLLALIHAPAWKIIFSARKFELKHASTDELQKVAAELEELGTRTVSLVKSRRVDYRTTDWDALKNKYDKIADYISQLSGQAVLLDRDE